MCVQGKQRRKKPFVAGEAGSGQANLSYGEILVLKYTITVTLDDHFLRRISVIGATTSSNNLLDM